jgi:L-malate glycosyltransferase
VARDFDDGWVNILFVGRVIPNKRIEDLIRFFHAYKTRFNPRSRLIVVGSYGGFEKYLAMLHGLVARLGTRDVHLAGHVSNEELAAYYQVADLFLCASEHEGFCVPLIEAFHARLPVVAYAATAVPATMDGAGVLFDDRDPVHVAAIVDAVVSDGDLYARILEGQDAALARLQARDFGATLLRFVDEALAAPRHADARVAYDFWDQYTATERLKELQLYRPAIYRALPVGDAPGRVR